MSEMKYAHEAIFCIVNSGYSETVMEAAKKFGARGGTVINARGTAGKDAEKFFGITVQQEKEIVRTERFKRQSASLMRKQDIRRRPRCDGAFIRRRI